jgi:hypothetical protein
MSWYFGELRLASGQDAAAIDYFDAHARGSGLTDTAWIGQLVASARDYRTGLAALEQRIPEIIASLPVHDISEWEYRLNQWYLLFGFLDRYYEIILALDPGEDAWSEAMYYLWGGTIYRDLGFTGHPRYVEIAERMGFVGVWEQRGPPDFCEKSTGKWVCY